MDTSDQNPKKNDPRLTLLKADRGFSHIEGPELTEDERALNLDHVL